MFVDEKKAANDIEKEEINKVLDFILEKNKKWYWIKKRTFSVIFAIIGIIIFAIPMLIITLLIWLSDREASPIYCQTRIGRHGKPFTLYKFRTMTDERDEDGNLLPDDVRLTKFGKLLRSTSLDELPEAFKIL